MNRRFYFLILSLFITRIGLSQEDTIVKQENQRFSISILIGTSVPLGDFSFYPQQEAYSEILSGAPKIGFSCNVNMSYLFPKYHFGVLLSFLSSVNGNYSEHEGFYYRIPSSAMGSYIHWDTYTYKSSHWYFYSLLAGIFVEPVHNPNISLRIWLSGGLMYAVSPETELNQSGEYGIYSKPPIPFTQKIVQSQMFSHKLALNTGTSLSIRITRNLKALISFDFLASDAIFNGNIESNFYSFGKSSNDIRSITITKRVYMLYGNVGVAYFIK